MPASFRIHVLLVTALAVLFYLFFMTAKHDAALSKVSAFGEDPYDAVGSFGIQAAILLSVVGLARAFRPYRNGAASEGQQELLVRTLIFALLAVGVTLAGDAVAMARYPSQWFGSADGFRLAALGAGLAGLTLAAGWWVRRSLKARNAQTAPGIARRAAVVSIASAAILAVYPESWRDSTPGALFTVVVGAVLLFAPMWAWGALLMPNGVIQKATGTPSQRFKLPRPVPLSWGLMLGLGILLGGFLVLAEFLVEGTGGVNLGHVAFVASIYIGLETAGLGIGYSLLRKPLGLFTASSG